jgi:thiamine-phosphate pyrophosphorylase
MDRGDWKAIVTAACERVGQSLRCLEEFSKLIDETSGLNFKALRYRAYDILAQLELRLLRDPSLQRAQIYLLVDCALPIDDFKESMRAFADAGVDLFQLRDKACDGRQLVQYARAAIESLSRSSARVIINDRIDVALASGAAGVHLGQEDLTLQDARRMAGSQMWIGVSTHSLEQAVAAERAGADYIGCGPTFPSRTKSFSEFPGTRLISEVAATVSLPAFAIGGIDANNLGEAMAAGCRRVALSSAIHQSENPTSSVREMKRRLSIAGLCNGTDVTL